MLSKVAGRGYQDGQEGFSAHSCEMGQKRAAYEPDSVKFARQEMGAVVVRGRGMDEGVCP